MEADFFMNTDPQLFEGELEQGQTIKKNKKKKKLNKKQDYSRSIKQCPSSPYKCKTHTDQKLRLRCFDINNPPTCRSCGIKLEGTTGYLSCPKSANCFTICSVCRICPNNHILRNVTTKDGQFKCDGCQKQILIEQCHDGVMHCGSCNYNVCMPCIDLMQKTWQQGFVLKKCLNQIPEEQQ